MTLLSLFLISSSVAIHAEYAGEKLVAAYYSDRYHVASCKIARKIHPDDLVTYKTPEEAVAAGLVPCKKCGPPTTSVLPDDRSK